MADENKPDTDNDTPSPVRQVDDRGLAGSEPVSTTDKEPDSALGGGTATRSGADEQPNPAEERSE